MSNRKIITMGSAAEPGPEFQRAVQALLKAFLQQYPRAWLALSQGFKVSIQHQAETPNTLKGVWSWAPLVEIEGRLNTMPGPSDFIQLGGQ